jgi:hypothetical protein
MATERAEFAFGMVKSIIAEADSDFTAPSTYDIETAFKMIQNVILYYQTRG